VPALEVWTFPISTSPCMIRVFGACGGWVFLGWGWEVTLSGAWVTSWLATTTVKSGELDIIACTDFWPPRGLALGPLCLLRRFCASCILGQVSVVAECGPPQLPYLADICWQVWRRPVIVLLAKTMVAYHTELKAWEERKEIAGLCVAQYI